jgi:hypothetical protein
MITTWTPAEFVRIDNSDELQIASRRADGTLRRWVPIWVVHTGEHVYVRTWNRRDTGWFGAALRTRRARIRMPGLEVDVAVEDHGLDAELRAPVDTAYRTKYRRYGEASVHGMVTDDAAASTLRLIPERTSP